MSLMTQTDQGVTHCEECSAPVEHDQRYCIVCGAHRPGAPDPAARYFSEASAARSRVAAARAARAAAAGRRRPAPRLSAATAVLLTVAALGAGFGIGRSSGAGTPARPTVAAGLTATSTTKHSTRTARGGGNATGRGYVNQESNLPSSVSEP